MEKQEYDGNEVEEQEEEEEEEEEGQEELEDEEEDGRVGVSQAETTVDGDAKGGIRTRKGPVHRREIPT
ncbi:hypothetical protein M0804_000343 [Polistes exclamans]|nr:hypothetical protein M0804_000343 [Polistes exclamans]